MVCGLGAAAALARIPTAGGVAGSHGSGGVGGGIASGLVEITAVTAGLPERHGTGIVVSAEAVVVTNDHVVAGAGSVSASVGGHAYPVAVVGADPAADVAVLRLVGVAGLRPASFGVSSAVRVGAAVTSVGYAVGRHHLVSSPGRVEAVGRTVVVTDPLSGRMEQLAGLVQVSAAVRPGESGGALIDTSGAVVGMDTASDSRGGGGFAIPAQRVLMVAERIEARSTT